MRLSFLVFGHFFRSWLSYVFVSKPGSPFEYAAYNLFQPTFRIPQSAKNKPLLVLKSFASFLKQCFRKKENQSDGSGEVYIYDLKADSFQRRKEYVEYFSEKKVSGGVFKAQAGVPTILSGFVLLACNTFWLPWIFLHSLFRKDKAPFAVLFSEQIELLSLLSSLKKKNAKELYFFCIYEKDSNLATLVLQKQNIKVNKIPSEVPLAIWNKILIADSLCLCSGYQYDEIKYFKKSVFVDKVELFGPENALRNIEKYSHSVAPAKKTIGFYSTGAWIRKMEDHSDQGFDMEQAEENVKTALLDFCKKKPGLKLIVYLHPREKWDKYYSRTLQKYQEAFGEIEYELFDKSVGSSEAFEHADVGVAFQSTIVYERLYYGFKTLLMPDGISEFPVPGSNMVNICCFSGEELATKIENSVGLSNKEFFAQNEIDHFAKYLYN